MAKQKNEQGYKEAVEEIEAILAGFENEDFDVDTLASQVRRATELIKLCRAKLKRTEDEVNEILRGE